MNARERVLSYLIAAVLLLALPAAAAGQKSGPPEGSLIGSWQCQGPHGVSRLVFESKGRLVFDGDPATYTLIPGAIRVRDEDGIEDYRYTLKGNALHITFPDGSRLQCQKAAPATAGSALKGSSTAAASSRAAARVFRRLSSRR